MPTITLDGHSSVYFAAWKHHIGVYPIPRADEALEKDLAPYRSTKDTVRLPLDQPIPYDLVERVVALSSNGGWTTNQPPRGDEICCPSGSTP